MSRCARRPLPRQPAANPHATPLACARSALLPPLGCMLCRCQLRPCTAAAYCSFADAVARSSRAACVLVWKHSHACSRCASCGGVRWACRNCCTWGGSRWAGVECA